MKKSLIALAALIAVGSSFATTPGNTVTGSATSSVAGSTTSYSVVNGVNQSSMHGSFATSQNSTTIVGFSAPGAKGASAGTTAVTTGSPLTGAGGVGFGSSASIAGQAGFGSITSISNVDCNNIVGSVTAHSDAGVNTWSSAANVNSGAALSGSRGGAFNGTMVSVSGVGIDGGVTATAMGGTLGLDGVETFGQVLGSNEIVNAGGESAQNGSYKGTLTNTYTVAVNAPSCTSGCGNESSDKDKVKGNNGYGNENQAAPGGSGDHNNAENGSQGGTGKNGKPRNSN